MLTFDKEGLEIFNRFEVDGNLPKHKGVIQNSIIFGTSGADNFWIPPSNSGLKFVRRGNFFFKMGLWFKSLYKDITCISVEDFFKSVKTSSIKVELLDERLVGYKSLLARAESSGQVALREKLLSEMEIIKHESVLLAAGFDKVVTEELVVKFAKECKKGLRLDWVKNFTRIIPCEIIDVKNRLDELKVFDNYVVLHYDPQGKAYSKTKEEEKDPILFGVIRGSKKLYFVGDWIDEVCDLTLEKLGEVVGKDKLDEATLKVNVYGDVKDIPCNDKNV